ncbi:MAG: DUF2807 domain-containing protein [Saprospiraceae bacterium]|nr:DUF2807 domain-containing protein [Saprospiraceae bacterium]
MKIKLILAVLLSTSLVLPQTEAQNWWKNGIRGEGESVTEEVRLDRFSGVINAFSCDIYLTQGQNQSVRLEGQENILANMVLDVNPNGILKIKSDRPVRTHKPVKVYITIPDLEILKVAGSGNIKTESAFDNLQDLDLGVSGSGNMSIDIHADEIKAKITGSGNINIGGSASLADVGITGSGSFNGFDMEVENSEATITGSGTAKIQISHSLDARIVGSGNILYKGDARDISSKITGSGSVRSAR